jgi:hypothetical protein
MRFHTKSRNESVSVLAIELASLILKHGNFRVRNHVCALRYVERIGVCSPRRPLRSVDILFSVGTRYVLQVVRNNTISVENFCIFAILFTNSTRLRNKLSFSASHSRSTPVPSRYTIAAETHISGTCVALFDDFSVKHRHYPGSDSNAHFLQVILERDECRW